MAPHSPFHHLTYRFSWLGLNDFNARLAVQRVHAKAEDAQSVPRVIGENLVAFGMLAGFLIWVLVAEIRWAVDLGVDYSCR